MTKHHGRIAIFFLGFTTAQACGDGGNNGESESGSEGEETSDTMPPEPVCNDDGICDAGEEICLDCASCGDGLKDPSEPCDDGNEANDDACVAPCQLATCGDGYVQDGVEACDDGPANSDGPSVEEHCNLDCEIVPSTCGDGACDPHENSSSCNEDCKETCGDMVLNVGEYCDDGPDGSATCDKSCTDAVCGDGEHNQLAGEECDDGDADETNECIHGCKLATCGDGIHRTDTDSEEQCDDGNDDDTDSCSNECKIIEHRTVFVTGTSYTGDFGGLEGADAECNDVAAMAGVDGNFRAWLSGTVDGPATRFDTDFRGVYELNDADRTVVATNGWVGLTTQPLQHAIDIDESGSQYITGVWTNTDVDGTPLNPDQSCSDWSSIDTNAAVGNSGAIDVEWTLEYEDQSCITSFSLYCFQDV